MTTYPATSDKPYGSDLPGGDPTDSVELDKHGADLVDSLAQARAAIKAWQEIEYKTKGQLAALIGDAKHGNVLGEKRVTVVRTTPNRFDRKLFKNDHPRLYNEYVHPGDPVTTVLLSSE